jgi:hypothetical protein
VPLWSWVLIWTLLPLAALTFHITLAVGLWRRGAALGRELAAAAERAEELTRIAERLQPAAPPPAVPTVLENPADLRRARKAAARRRAHRTLRAARAAGLTGTQALQNASASPLPRFHLSQPSPNPSPEP